MKEVWGTFQKLGNGAESCVRSYKNTEEGQWPSQAGPRAFDRARRCQSGGAGKDILEKAALRVQSGGENVVALNTTNHSVCLETEDDLKDELGEVGKNQWRSRSYFSQLSTLYFILMA